MKSKHPELRELAYAAYAAIRRWEENDEKKAQPSEEPDLNGDHMRGDAHPAARCERDGLAGSDDPDHSDRAGADLDRALCMGE